MTAAAFLVAAAALAVCLPAQRDFDAPLAAALVATYALLARVHFPIGYGFTVPTQLVFVPMLFLLPLGAVPLLVAAGMLLGGLPEYLRGDRHPSRALAAVGDAWHAVGPVAVLAAGGVTAPAPRRLAAAARRAGRADRHRQRRRDAPRLRRPRHPAEASARRCSAGSRSWTSCSPRWACSPRWPP